MRRQPASRSVEPPGASQSQKPAASPSFDGVRSWISSAGSLSPFSDESQRHWYVTVACFVLSHGLFLVLLLPFTNQLEYDASGLEDRLNALPWAWGHMLAAVPAHDPTGGTHSYSALSALLQLFQVTALALCWFYCARLIGGMDSRQGQIAVFTPTAGLSILYTLVMRSLYVPAVLVLTIVAIFFAAEHFAALEHTDRALTHTDETLLRTEARFKEAERSIARLAGDELGEAWRKRIYREIGHPPYSWTGKMRFFEIDESFITHVSAAFDNYPLEASGLVHDYGPYLSRFIAGFESYRTIPFRDHDLTLYQALIAAADRAVESLIDGTPAARASGVRLIYEPERHGPGVLEPKGTGDLRALAGVMFQLIVFHEVNQHARKALRDASNSLVGSTTPASLLRLSRFARIRVGHSAPWVHVVNQTRVYEVETYSTPDNPTLGWGRTIVYDLSTRRPDVAHELARHYLGTVTRDLSMGGSAEAWVASQLRCLFQDSAKPQKGEADTQEQPWQRSLNVLRKIYRDDPIALDEFKDNSDDFCEFFMILVAGFIGLIASEDYRSLSRSDDVARRGHVHDRNGTDFTDTLVHLILR